MARLAGAAFLAAVAWVAATGPSGAASPSVHLAAAGALNDPAHDETPVPDYTSVCPVTLDSSPLCLRVTLGAIDHARALEGLGPMKIPQNFGLLPVPEQVLIAVNNERVDRGLAPFAGLSEALNLRAQHGAETGNTPDVAKGSNERSDWIGQINNGLDADFAWMYGDGPTGRPQDCASTSTCWSDRRLFLSDYGGGTRTPVMGAALDPTGDTSAGDRGGSSLAVIVGSADPAPSSYTFAWSTALAGTSAGTLAPLTRIPTNLASSGIANPKNNIQPVPEYWNSCSSTGIDDSRACVSATLAAVNHAHSLEGVPPMVLPSDFATLSVPEQIFTVIDLERVDRGLRPFVGLTAALNANAQRGADTANDPPDAGPAYPQTDGEWAGGNSNGLDADYGWMYDDGYNSGNLDCPHRNSPGCWGHRTGILDNYGTGGTLEMGAAFNRHGDNNRGDKGGPSMAATLAVTYAVPGPFLFTWDEVTAKMPTPPPVPP